MTDDNYVSPDLQYLILPKARYFDWQPKADITAYELALCQDLLRFQLVGGSGGALYDSLPDSAKRHWIVRGGHE